LNCDEKVSDLALRHVLTGIRQAGKTRHSFPRHEWVLLDRAGIVSEARSDPALFLRNHPPPCIFDEVQRVPELFLELKDLIDQNNPGRREIILTGPFDWCMAESVQADLYDAKQESTLYQRGEYRGRGVG